MQRRIAFTFLLLSISTLCNIHVLANEPDSAYLFAYSTKVKHSGLYFAWSLDKENWHCIGSPYRFLSCDYGNWSSEKSMSFPYLFLDQDTLWHCVWSVNNTDGVFAHASSKDLINWKPQSYPNVMKEGNCLQPEVAFNKITGQYTVSWQSMSNGKSQSYAVNTNDFKTYSETRTISNPSRLDQRKKAVILGKEEVGVAVKVPWDVIKKLINAEKLAAYNQQLTDEHYLDDSIRYKDLKAFNATLTIAPSESKAISDMMFGIFFEDINYAADGGLYAELVQNRGFEYNLHDKKGQDTTWNSTKAWSFKGESSRFVIDTVSPIHPNNRHYGILQIGKIGAKLSNEGFNGIAIQKGERYHFSAFFRLHGKKHFSFKVRIVDENGTEVGNTVVKVRSSVWKKETGIITATKTTAHATLEIEPLATGRIDVDMISLFPQNTFKGRENGMRADLARTIASLNPRFIRFPGGCVAHGDGIHNIYKWKNTIGPLETRKPQRNIWDYHQSYGLGFYEYFQFCEDIGAEPIPVVAAGVPCQNSSDGGAGQQGGVPMCDMGDYVQDILDLIEYCNGDRHTTWGRKRAEAGHPEPFDLKYIGIGNEDMITDIFKERFEMIYRAIARQYPDITVIGTVGPFSEGSDYVEGWKFATRLNVPIVDEHYYQRPGWFINNQDFYDKYDRDKPAVYLGEYASWGNELFNALAEALYLTSIERNGDVVKMTSYAPLLAKYGATQWGTDMIFFDNSKIDLTPNYYVQKLYGQNTGNSYIGNSLQLSVNDREVMKRVGASVVRDDETGALIVKLVSLLPTSVNTLVRLSGNKELPAVAKCILLTGSPSDKKVEPFEKQLYTEDGLKLQLPPYSFTIIRIEP